MLRHTVETCTDDLALLQDRLDAIADEGARIVSVVWQPRRVEENAQSAALDARGGFVIIVGHPGTPVLRQRQPIGDVFDEVLQTGGA